MSKLNSFILVTVFVIVLGASLFLGYTYFKETGSLLPKNKSPQLDSELIEALSEETEIGWDSLLVEAQSDCEPVGELTLIVEKEEYLNGLRRDMFAAVNIEENFAFHSFAAPIPRTRTCWAIWVGDDEGVGFGGYRTMSDNIVVYSIGLSEEIFRENIP